MRREGRAYLIGGRKTPQKKTCSQSRRKPLKVRSRVKKIAIKKIAKFKGVPPEERFLARKKGEKVRCRVQKRRGAL